MRIRKAKISVEFEAEYNEVEWRDIWIPQTVYKYRDWDRMDHRKILTEQSIWIPDTNNFNDPFDCNIPISYELIASNENLAEEFIRNLVKADQSISEMNYEEEVQNRLQSGKHKDLDFLQNYKKYMLKAMKSVKGVFSVTPINDNILMWSHYANSHKGFCVGFDSLKLFESLGGGGMVNYENEYPIISPVADYTRQYSEQVLTKSKHWAYEFEYRLTTFNKLNEAIGISADCISEVIFGVKMDLNTKIEIKELAKSKLPHLKFYNVLTEEGNFKLKIVQEE